MTSTHVPAAILLVALTATIAPAAEPPATRPAVNRGVARMTAADIERLILELGDDDAQVRDLAQLRARNLPGEAYDLLVAGFNPDDLSPQARGSINSVLKPLKVRHAASLILLADHQWLLGQARANYDLLGGSPPESDAAARAAIEAIGVPTDPVTGPTPADLKGLFDKAIDAGSRNPVIVTLHTYLELVATGSQWLVLPRAYEPAQPRLAGNWREPAPLERRMEQAVKAMSESAASAYFRCMAHQTLARLVSVRWGQSPVVIQQADLARGLLPEALLAPDITERWQTDLLFKQMVAVAAHASVRQIVDAIDDLHRLYRDSVENSPGPSVFASIEKTNLCWRIQDRGFRDINLQPGGLGAQVLASAATVAEKGAAAFPTDVRFPRIMMDLCLLRRDSADAVNEWYRRAVGVDPDNLDAAFARAWTMSPLWYDDPDGMKTFARECMAIRNYRSQVSLLPAQLHIWATRTRNAGGYFPTPGVWESLEETYAQALRAVPESRTYRAAFAKYAMLCRRYPEADALLQSLPDRAEPADWLSQAELDGARLEAAAQSAGLAFIAPAPTPPQLSPPVLRVLERISRQEIDFAAGLQSVAKDFPEMKVVDVPGKHHWNRVTLNTAALTYDCVRFRTPRDGPRDMRWAYSYAETLGPSWYIFRSDGKPMRGFRNYMLYKGIEVGEVRNPGDGGDHTVILQTLDAASLEPDTEYLIWFRFRHDLPVRTTVAITFVPPAQGEVNYTQFFKDTGLTGRRPKQ